MNLRTIKAIVMKDALDMLLNRSALVALVTPIVLALFFIGVGSVLSSKTWALLVYDPGNSGVTALLQEIYPQDTITQATSAEEVISAFGEDGTQRDNAPYALGVVVPTDFEAQLQRGEQPEIALYVNGDEVGEGTGTLIMSMVEQYARTVVNPEPPARVSLTTINPAQSIAQDLSHFYIVLSLLTAFPVGTVLVPSLLIEEKERKTLRFLLISPASFTDVVIAKLLVGLVYAFLVVGVVLVVVGGLIGQVGVVLLLVFLGALMGVALGLLAGSIFQTMHGVGIFSGLMGVLYFLPLLVVGPIGVGFATNPLLQLIKVMPTAYLAETLLLALQGQAQPAEITFTLTLLVGVTMAVLAAAIGVLRRQTGRMALI